MATSHAYGFSKSKRLLNAGDYSSVFNDAQIKVSTKNILLLSRKNSTNTPRLGLIVAKKHVKRANQRNRVKRQIRESFRYQQHHIDNRDIVILIRGNIDTLENSAIKQQLDHLWSQLDKKIKRNA